MVETKSTKTTRRAKPKAEAVKEAPKATPVEEPKKKHQAGDLIDCMSLCNGVFIHTGRKTGQIYDFAELGVVEQVHYEDLRAEALNSHSAVVYNPLLLVQDEAFLDEFPRVRKAYANYFSPEEWTKIILRESAEKLEKMVVAMPEADKEKVKTIVSTLVSSGELDSLAKAKMLDEVLGTEFTERAGA